MTVRALYLLFCPFDAMDIDNFSIGYIDVPFTVR